MGVVKSFQRVRHISHCPPPQHQRMEIEMHGHVVSAHKIELPQQIG